MQIINFEYDHLIVKPSDLDLLSKYTDEAIDDFNTERHLEELGIKASSLKEAFRNHIEEFYDERNEYMRQENAKVIPTIEEEFANAKFESFSITDEEDLHKTLITIKAPKNITSELYRKIENLLKERDKRLAEELDPISKDALSAKSLYEVFRPYIDDEEILNALAEKVKWS